MTDVRFLPDSELEEFGVEDPRITALDDRFVFTYVAVSRHGAATALASTADFRHFDRHGVIFCPENKDVVLFPERIDGEYFALHRPNAATPFCRPEMWLARSPDLIHWGKHVCLHGGGAEWETGRVGAGTPPVRVADGWLEIYHGNRQPTRPGEVGVYSTGALLLDANNPARVLAARRRRFSSRRPSSNDAALFRMWCFPRGSSRQEIRTLSFMERRIRARRWWSFPRVRSWRRSYNGVCQRSAHRQISSRNWPVILGEITSTLVGATLLEFTVPGPPVSHQSHNKAKLIDWRERVRSFVAMVWGSQQYVRVEQAAAGI